MTQHLKEYLPHFIVAGFVPLVLLIGVLTNDATVGRKAAAMNAATAAVQVATKQ